MRERENGSGKGAGVKLSEGPVELTQGGKTKGARVKGNFSTVVSIAPDVGSFIFNDENKVFIS